MIIIYIFLLLFKSYFRIYYYYTFIIINSITRFIYTFIYTFSLYNIFKSLHFLSSKQEFFEFVMQLHAADTMLTSNKSKACCALSLLFLLAIPGIIMMVLGIYTEVIFQKTLTFNQTMCSNMVYNVTIMRSGQFGWRSEAWTKDESNSTVRLVFPPLPNGLAQSIFSADKSENVEWKTALGIQPFVCFVQGNVGIVRHLCRNTYRALIIIGSIFVIVFCIVTLPLCLSACPSRRRNVEYGLVSNHQRFVNPISVIIPMFKPNPPPPRNLNYPPGVK